MNRLAFVVLSILTISFISSKIVTGQVDPSGSMILSGKIIDDSLEYALPSVHVWNESSRMGGISDDSGEFSIKAGTQDTVVFSAIGYSTYIMAVSFPYTQPMVVRLEPVKYEIDELVVRRFRSYESFKYQVLHLDLPEAGTSDLRAYVKLTSTAAALDADRERAVKDKLEIGFGYITPLGKGLDREKAFKERIYLQEMRERVINAKFNRVLVGDITHLEGHELSEFIAMCDYSEEFLYETDLYTIIEDLYAKLDDYHNRKDTIPGAGTQ